MRSERQSVGRFEWEQALRETPGISMALRGVLSLMATYATTKTGEDIRPSLSAVAERLGVHRPSLSRSVANAVRLGWLECTEDNSLHGKPSVYRLTIPSTECTPERTGGVRLSEHRVCAPTDTTYTDTSAPTSTNTSTEPTGDAAWAEAEAQDLAAKAKAAAERDGLIAGAPDFD